MLCDFIYQCAEDVSVILLHDTTGNNSDGKILYDRGDPGVESSWESIVPSGSVRCAEALTLVKILYILIMVKDVNRGIFLKDGEVDWI